MNYFKIISVFALILVLYSCQKEEPDTSMVVPKGDVQVGVYYFPLYSGPAEQSEWSILKGAKQLLSNHYLPVPLWGYTDESDPKVMAQKIEAASENGIDAFIFDWYFYDPGSDKVLNTPTKWYTDQMYIAHALHNGFLKAPNRNKLKFAIMWTNHDLANVKGMVKESTFYGMVDYVIQNYFKHPSYWKINGCPYFSIYSFEEFYKSFGSDAIRCGLAIDYFRQKTKEAGFPDLHLASCLHVIPEKVLWENISTPDASTPKAIKLNSLTTYSWINHAAPGNKPYAEYVNWGDRYYNALENGAVGYENGGSGNLNYGQKNKPFPVPFHYNVTMGWDNTPRTGLEQMNSIVKGNTPEVFKKYLIRAKQLTMERNAEKDRVVTIEAWNEWCEGSHLEPCTRYGMGYLQAVRDVFGDNGN